MRPLLPVLGLLVVVVVGSLAQDIPVAVILDPIPGDTDTLDVLTVTNDKSATTTNTDSEKPSTILTGQDDETKLTKTEDKKNEIDDEDSSKTAASQVAPSVVANREKRQLGGLGGGIGLGGGGIGLGGGQFGGFGGGYGGGSGYGGGYGSNNGFGGSKKIQGGNQFGANYGGLNKNVKLVNDQFQSSQHGTKGLKGNQGFSGQQGHVKVDNGHINKSNKKGHFGTVGQASKAAKNDGSVYGNNNFATKLVKGTKFGNKGVHKKGHNTKGFHNTHHKDEYSKSHQFHDTKDDVNFFDKYGDEGAFNNNLAGKQFYNGHHNDVFNKKNEGNAGNFIAGHHNIGNKGTNAQFGNKAHNVHNNHYNQQGGLNYASGIGKGIHNNNNYGGTFGGGGFGKVGGVGGHGSGGGYQGGVGNYGGGGGGFGFGGGY